MVIVIVRWYITAGKRDVFKNFWINDMDPKNKQGLFREFFSEPVEEDQDKYHTLDLESKHYSTIINVGIWNSVKDFENAIGHLIPSRVKMPDTENKELIEVYDFEFKLRERILMEVVMDRIGDWNLPEAKLK